MLIESFAATLLFAAAFLFGGRVHVTRSPRAALSLGAGISTAYVFVHLLPELGEAGAVFVRETTRLSLPFPEMRIYMSALLGFLAFYGMEHMVAWSREQRSQEAQGAEQGHGGWIFFLHIGGFALYGALVSYLMVRGITEEPAPITLYAVAMGLHFVSLAHSLLREHGAAYTRVGRFVLAGAVLVGWASAVVMEIPKPTLITGLGLVYGGVVMNSMVMELPSEKDGRFWPFALGAVLYTAVLLMV
jgi:hypothetical protein